MTAALATARQRIIATIDANASKAITELRAISAFHRRSLGQRVRWAMIRGGR